MREGRRSPLRGKRKFRKAYEICFSSHHVSNKRFFIETAQGAYDFTLDELYSDEEANKYLLEILEGYDWRETRFSFVIEYVEHAFSDIANITEGWMPDCGVWRISSLYGRITQQDKDPAYCMNKDFVEIFRRLLSHAAYETDKELAKREKATWPPGTD
jgi:hypothetical protein